MWYFIFMTVSSRDKAPEMLSIKYNFEDGTFAQLSIPEMELDKLQPTDRNGVVDSAALIMVGIIKGTLPEKEDYDRVMSIEGSSLVLPDTHGLIEIQTLIGEQLLSGAKIDLEKYN
jgi:tellurite resistance-related uncharacterized protein